MTPTEAFTNRLPIVEQFSTAFDAGRFVAVPDHWLIGVTDVVGSRDAIAKGRYKAVNMAGAAAITAVINGLQSHHVPFVFGGDGSAILCAPEDGPVMREALARTAAWVRDELDLQLRVAAIPVSACRTAGHTVDVVGVRVSDAVHVYAFLGGGVTYAEASMKAGSFAIAPAPIGEHPDLSGLSCRWTPIRAHGERVVSLIMDPTEKGRDAFDAIARDIVSLAGGEQSSPMPTEGPGFTWPPEGLSLEAHATRNGRPFPLRLAQVAAETLLARLVDLIGRPIAGFDPKRYKRYTSLNTDHRKVQDGLRMTLRLDVDEREALTERLDAFKAEGLIAYGLCEQDRAVLTCFVPSVTSDMHFHFLDGAGGGYAAAATAMQSAATSR
ncbi:MAG: DUF3095 family protein [Pseudomonadota bacterium]